MRRFRIGSAFGIPIKLDLTFLLVLPLLAFAIATQVDLWVGILNDFAGTSLDAGVLSQSPMPWVLGTVAAVGLFAGIVLHELGHSLVALRFGYPIDSITLWLFGGIAQFEEMPEKWTQELLISIAGPLVSVVLGLVSFGAFLAIPGSHTLAFDGGRFVLGYLALMNVILAGFNMLPGFPMDGGRVLRALLARNRPYAEATQLAAEVGKGFALLLGLVGLLVWFNLFLIALAFFIYIGAAGEAQQTVTRAAFEGVSVRDIMTPVDRVETVSEDTSVASLIERMFEDRHTGYPVERDGDVVGVVTLADTHQVREVERDAYTVGDVMSSDIESIDADAEAMDALERIQRADIGRLLVFDGETFVGLLTRSDIMTALSILRASGQSERPAADLLEEENLRPGL